MKHFLLIVFSILSIETFAQFPKPANFHLAYHYYELFEEGSCGGQWVYGPSYCFTFGWSAPDISTTTATLDHYNLYYDNLMQPDSGVVEASATDTNYITLGGFMGRMWVTAVYKNPDGESDSSNVAINEDLPISVAERSPADQINIAYNGDFKEIIISDIDRVEEYGIYNMMGDKLISGEPTGRVLSIAQLSSGLYIFEIRTKDHLVIRKKLIK